LAMRQYLSANLAAIDATLSRNMKQAEGAQK